MSNESIDQQGTQRPAHRRRRGNVNSVNNAGGANSVDPIPAPEHKSQDNGTSHGMPGMPPVPVPTSPSSGSAWTGDDPFDRIDDMDGGSTGGKAHARHSSSRPKDGFNINDVAAPVPTGDETVFARSRSKHKPFYARVSTWVILIIGILVLNLASCGCGILISSTIAGGVAQSAVDTFIGSSYDDSSDIETYTPESYDEYRNTTGEKLTDGSGNATNNGADDESDDVTPDEAVAVLNDTDGIGVEFSVGGYDNASNIRFAVDGEDIVLECDVALDDDETGTLPSIMFTLYDYEDRMMGTAYGDVSADGTASAKVTLDDVTAPVAETLVTDCGSVKLTMLA